jgi:hypothetical protein
MVFWDVTLYSLVDRYQSLGEPTVDTPVPIYQITYRQIRKDKW